VMRRGRGGSRGESEECDGGKELIIDHRDCPIIHCGISGISDDWKQRL
jgi:hypothetical protein